MKIIFIELSIILPDFKKHGWLKVELHPDSSRKRVYKLKSPTKALAEIAEKTF